MGNPLYQMMSGPQNQSNNIIERFNRFCRSFKGDPRQQIQDLMNSGKITQSQYNQAVQMAQQFQRFIGR